MPVEQRQISEMEIEVGREGDREAVDESPVGPSGHASNAEIVSCTGYKPNVPNPFSLNYPFQLHALMKLPFSVSEERLFSEKCRLTVDLPGEACESCEMLPFMKAVEQIESRAHVADKHINLHFLTYSQLQERIEKLKTERSDLWLSSLNQAHKLNRIAKSLEAHKRLVFCLSENDVPRLRQLLKVALRNGRNIHYVIDKVHEAIMGLYRARGYTRGYTEKDIDLGCLILRIGGPRLLHALRQVYGLPSVSFLYQKSIPAFKACTGAFSSEVLRANIDQMISESSESSRCLWVLMWDEVSTEKRLRWNAADNLLYGLCREHGHRVNLEFNTVEDVAAVCRGIQQDVVHMCSEVSVLAVASICTNDYRAIALLALPTCKHSTATEQAQIVTAFLSEWKSNPKTQSLGPIISVGSDGDAARRRCLHDVLTIESPTSALCTILDQLPLLDLSTGEGDITMHFDDKHLVKRIRELLKSFTRGCVIHQHTITGAVLEQLMEKLAVPGARKFLHPDDSQNVPLTVGLLKLIAELPELDRSTLTPMEQQIMCEISILSLICEAILSPLIVCSHSLSQQLSHLSLLSHALMVLYRRSRTKFIPSQLYHDIQATVKDCYFTVVKVQQYMPQESLYLFQLGTDRLKALFSVLRTLTHNRNFDLLECGHRLSHATHLNQIYQRHPDWKWKAKRLEGSLDEMNPKSWRGSVKVADVDVVKCWFDGRTKCVDALSRSGLFSIGELDFDAFVEKRYTLCRPNGAWIGETEEESERLLCIADEEREVGEEVVVDDSELDLEDVLPGGDANEVRFEAYVDFEGHRTHKASVVCLMLSGDPKSTDRLRRVRRSVTARGGLVTAHADRSPHKSDRK